MIHRIILADNQAIFRAGAARVLAMEDDFRLVAQCAENERLTQAVMNHKGAIVVLTSAMHPDWQSLLTATSANGCRIVLVTENNEEPPAPLQARLDGMIPRSVAGNELVDCVRRVGRGYRSFPNSQSTPTQPPDSVGARVRARLTPRELQIVGYIVQGCKNKEIATHLGTKEQVVKNYLRSIYDKTGVSDRLELALFTIHHRVLADTPPTAANILQMKSA